MTSRVALYARYSTDMQRDASIEDQLRVCRTFAEAQSWAIVDSYFDRAISGASMLRQGVQDLLADASARRFDIVLADASARRFDIVLAEAMDRLSRDQADIAMLYKHLSFAGVRIVTIAEGEISEMHIGLKGTMNALFLKDLGLKTHRGLRGRVEAGKSGGGNSYGYEVVRSFNSHGTLIAGERRIKPDEADTVRHILLDFANGKSPRNIAHALNREKVPGPRGAAWGQSTINGNAERGTGILNNELYVGRLVWNRLHYVKDPVTGRRVSRPNPPEKIITTNVPDLRIVDDDLWQAVKARQVDARKRAFPVQGVASANGDMAADGRNSSGNRAGFWSNRRPRHLLTGLMRCGVCGGSYTKLNTHHFGCATARNKGTCDNRLNIRVDTVDEIVLTGLKVRLMDPEAFKSFADSFVAERNAIVAHQNAKFIAAKCELARVKSRQKVLIQALADGVPARTVKDEMIILESKEDELTALLASQPSAEPSLHPSLAIVYRERIAALHEALEDSRSKDEAFSIIRTLIEEVRLVPEDGHLRVEIRGALAGILALATNGKNHLRRGGDGSVSVLVEQMKMVAGVGFEPTTFRL